MSIIREAIIIYYGQSSSFLRCPRNKIVSLYFPATIYNQNVKFYKATQQLQSPEKSHSNRFSRIAGILTYTYLCIVRTHTYTRTYSRFGSYSRQAIRSQCAYVQCKVWLSIQGQLHIPKNSWQVYREETTLSEQKNSQKLKIWLDTSIAINKPAYVRTYVRTSVRTYFVSTAGT